MTKWIKRRNWKNTSVKKVEASFEIALDQRFLTTPNKNKLCLPTRELAVKIAEEWEQQVDSIDSFQMPNTRLVNSAIDKVKKNYDSVVLDLLNYGDTDLLCYRSESPKDLISRQNTCWDPVLLWAKNELSIDLKTTCGVTYNAQDSEQISRIFEEISSYDYFTLAGFHDLVTISGSMLIALSLYHGQITPDHAIDISFLDEDWQREKWGQDEESTLNRANKSKDFKTAYEFLTLLS